MGTNKKKEKIDESKYSMDTQIIYGKDVSKKWDYSHHVTAPISSSTTFRLDSVDRGAQGFIQFAHSEKHGDETPILIMGVGAIIALEELRVAAAAR